MSYIISNTLEYLNFQKEEQRIILHMNMKSKCLFNLKFLF